MSVSPAVALTVVISAVLVADSVILNDDIRVSTFMVSLAPGAQDIVGPELGTVYIVGDGLIVTRTEVLDGVYLNVVLGSEVGIAVKVGEGLAPSSLASEAKRTEDRGIFKAKRTATSVL